MKTIKKLDEMSKESSINLQNIERRIKSYLYDNESLDFEGVLNFVKDRKKDYNLDLGGKHAYMICELEQNGKR